MKKSTIYAVCGVVLLAGAVFSGVQVFRGLYAPKTVETELSEPVEAASPSPEPTPTPTPAPTAVEEQATPTPEPTPTPTPYISPIDFESLQRKNSDIYAWLEIDDTNISYPIVQDPDDETFYLNHNSDRAYSANGAIFSEAIYNRTDLTDPVTILYGHHMRDGAMFGKLQQYYSDASFFADHGIIRVYTPEATLEYGVFAAIPYSSSHILYYNDFTDPEVFETFFDAIFNVRELGANFNEEYAPAVGDRVLILSTCLIGNNTRRFLVMATLLA